MANPELGHSDESDRGPLAVYRERMAATERAFGGALDYDYRTGVVHAAEALVAGDKFYVVPLTQQAETEAHHLAIDELRYRLETRRGEAQNRQAQAPLPASVSATPEESQRGLSDA